MKTQSVHLATAELSWGLVGRRIGEGTQQNRQKVFFVSVFWGGKEYRRPMLILLAIIILSFVKIIVEKRCFSSISLRRKLKADSVFPQITGCLGYPWDMTS